MADYIDKKNTRVVLKKVDQQISSISTYRKQLVADVETMYKNDVWHGGKRASNWYKALDENLVGVKNKIIADKRGSAHYNNRLILERITSLSKLAD